MGLKTGCRLRRGQVRTARQSLRRGGLYRPIRRQRELSGHRQDRLGGAADGADAVRPGYGFLSERTAFAKALADEEITFIGPNPEVIRLMGDKILANRAAKEAGVPTVPGHWDQIPTPDEAVTIAHSIGFPVMLKAAAGGGGKGIRIARDEAELRDAFRVATSEARSAFGDDRVFIEKFVEQPGHIEIQVLGDVFGNVIHLDERECSIQRPPSEGDREAPSPSSTTPRGVDGYARGRARSACGYNSRRHLQFIVDQRRNFSSSSRSIPGCRSSVR